MALIVDQAQASQVADAEVVRKQAQRLNYQDLCRHHYDGKARRLLEPGFDDQGQRSGCDMMWPCRTRQTSRDCWCNLTRPGVKAAFLTGFGAFFSSSMWESSKGLSNGGYTWIAQDLVKATGPLKELIDQYKLEYPQSAFTVNSLYGFDGVHVAIAAVKKADTTRTARRFNRLWQV